MGRKRLVRLSAYLTVTIAAEGVLNVSARQREAAFVSTLVHSQFDPLPPAKKQRCGTTCFIPADGLRQNEPKHTEQMKRLNKSRGGTKRLRET